MDDVLLQPPVSKRKGNPAVTVKPAGNRPVKSVEAKEMEVAEDDDDDEELSELESDAEGEPDDQDESAMHDEEMAKAPAKTKNLKRRMKTMMTRQHRPLEAEEARPISVR